MIDEKQIEETKESIFEDKFLNNGEDIIYTDDEGNEDYKEEMYNAEQIKEAIELGIHWAIKQFLKDLWHDKYEVPNFKEDGSIPVVAECYEGYDKYSCTVFFYKPLYRWQHEVFKNCITRWFYVDDLLQRQKGD